MMESMKKTFLIALLFVIACITAQAQDLQVSGTVISKTDGEPIIGASVVEVGNNINGTITDIDGNFSLSVKKDAQLTISYVGFKSQTVKASSMLNISMEEDSEMLEEIVVTGYTTQRKADLTGAVSVVSTEALKTHSVSRFQ